MKLTRQNLHKVANQIFETKNGYHHYTELAKGEYSKNGRFCALGYMMNAFGYTPKENHTNIAVVENFTKAIYEELTGQCYDDTVHKMLREIAITNDDADNYFDRARRTAKLIHGLAER